MKYWNTIHTIYKQKKTFFLGFGLYFLFAILMLLFIGNNEISKITNDISYPILDFIFFYLTYLGDGLITLAFLIIIFFYRISLGLVSMFSILIPSLVTQLLKRFCFFNSKRPGIVFKDLIHNKDWHIVDGVDLHSYMSFPSGHTTAVFSICCISILLIRNEFYHIPVLLIAILTGFSRIYLSQHFLIDVTVGSIIGCLGTFLLYSAFRDKFNSLEFSLFKNFK